MILSSKSISLPRHLLTSTLKPCTCSKFSTSNSNKKYNLTTLNSTRSILKVSGKDSFKFLQGLISNNINKLTPKGNPPIALTAEERLLFTAFLKPDGRMLHDVFISLAPTSTTTEESIPTLYLDHSSTSTTLLQTYLKRHILRSKVKISKEVEPRTIYVAWKSTEKELIEGENKLAEDWFEENLIGKDVRCNEMGYRWSSINESPILPPTSSSSFESVPATSYHLHRLTLAIPEGPKDWPQLPLEGNLDYMNGVDYKKGCYVGQELTARTFYKGVVRKRGVGLRIWREDGITINVEEGREGPELGSVLLPLNSTVARPRPSGKIGTSLIVDSNIINSLLPSTSTSTSNETLNKLIESSNILAFGSVRSEHIESNNEGMFRLKAPAPIIPPVDLSIPEVTPVASVIEQVKEVVEQVNEVIEKVVIPVEVVKEKEEIKWLAKAFIPEWIQEKIKAEQAREKAREVEEASR